MVRIVKWRRNGPYAILVEGKNQAFCGCGPSGSLRYCDGPHNVTKNEAPDKLYGYDGGRPHRGRQLSRYQHRAAAERSAAARPPGEIALIR